MTSVAHASFKKQGVHEGQILTIPAPFNTLLWRVLAMDEEGYYEGYYSLFDKTRNIGARYFQSDRTLLEGLEFHWPVQRLQWFTHGFYSVKQIGEDIVITDLRMGSEPFYVFQFKVAETGNPHGKPTKSQKIRIDRDWEQLKQIWIRIWRDLAIPS